MTNPGTKTEPYTPQDWSLNNIVELLVAEHCAPLVEAIERTIGNLDYLAITNRIDADGEAMLIDLRAALAAYRAAQGAGRGT